MRRTAVTLCLALCAALIIGGCFGSQAKKHYYRVYYRPQTARVVPVPAMARVKTLEIDKVYRRYNLVYRTSPYEIFYYPNHYWASRPEDMMTDLVYAHLKTTGLFTDLIVKLDRTPDYEVTGEIREIDMFDSGDRWFAHLSMVLVLKDFKTGAVLAAHPFDERREVFGREPVHTVRAIGEIAEQEIERFIQHIAAELGKK